MTVATPPKEVERPRELLYVLDRVIVESRASIVYGNLSNSRMYQIE